MTMVFGKGKNLPAAGKLFLSVSVTMPGLTIGEKKILL